VSFNESLEKIIAENRNQLVGKYHNWERVRLADVASVLNGFPFQSDSFTADPRAGRPLVRIRDLLRGTTNTYYRGEFDPTYLVKDGDLLVGMDGDFNSAVWRGGYGLLNQRVCRIAPQSDHYDGRFLAYALPGYLDAINAYTSSITVKHLSSHTVSDIPLPLPPKPEQARIADTLDELFSDLDAAVAALERTKAKLKLYRASVLKAAVEGELTAEWRARHPKTEHASELLLRILAERRRRWEEGQVAKSTARGLTAPKNWKAKYQEPMAVNGADALELPACWCCASLDALIVDGPQNGLYLPSTLYGRGVPIVRIDDFQNGWIRQSENLNRVEAGAETCATYGLRPNDLVINRVNSMTHLGKCFIVEDRHVGALFESNMMRSTLTANVVPKFVEFYLQSEAGRRQLTKDSKWAVNQASINQQDVKRTPIPLPPRAEQEAIVEVVEDQFSVIDHLESDIETKLKAAQSLRQSILRHAFTGKLVPQDPSDEPASELLKRIATERAARTHKHTAAKRPAKSAKQPRMTKRGRPRKVLESA
jgi:type I restriction enzyme S subunit